MISLFHVRYKSKRYYYKVVYTNALRTIAYMYVCYTVLYFEYDGVITHNKVIYMTNTISLLNWKITILIELKIVHKISLRNNYFNYLFDITAKVFSPSFGNTQT
jgi:hypothetical protein